MTEATIERLSNGLTVSLVDKPESHRVLVSLMVRVGSRFEHARNNGISHFIEHMLFQGNALHPTAQETALAFERVGGQPNAITGVEHTEIYFQAHPDHLGEGLEALERMVFSPTFDDLEKERAIIQEEILYDYNEGGELIHLGTLAGELLWKEHPLGLGVPGSSSVLDSLSQEDLRDYHRRFYTPENMVLAIAGRLEPGPTLAMVERIFGSASPGGGAPPASLLEGPLGEPGPSLKLVRDSDNQVHLQLSFPAPGYNSQEEPTLMVLTSILDDGPTSRLQRELRETRGLVYQVSCDYTGYQDVGQMDISSSIKAERLPEFLEALVNCLKAIKEKAPDPDELERVKARSRFDLEYSRDSLSAQLDRYGWPLLYSTIMDPEAELARIEAVTGKAVQELANQLFQREASALALVGPVGEETEKIVRAALDRL